MELLALQVTDMPNADRERGDRAFMAGVLSLVDVLLLTTLEDVVASLNLTDDIRNALLYREGHLGTLLQIAEQMEKADFSAAEEHLVQAHLTADQLASAQLETIAWSKGLAEYS
jgi:EAL and modified HD-GYP domain-containing signal transduction protein